MATAKYDVEWLTWITATGEPWFWRNPHIRLRRNVTNGLLASSPFSHLNEAVAGAHRALQGGRMAAGGLRSGKPGTWRL